MLSSPSPVDAEALYARGRGQRANRDDAGAEASYREALTLRPDFAEAWISLGILLKQAGRFTEAESAQRAALRLDPRNFLAHLNLGNVLRVQGRRAEAEQAFQAALAANPDSAEAHNNLGRLLLDQEQRADAAAHFTEALRISPNYFEAAHGIGEALLQADQFEAAIEPLKHAHALRPDDLNAMRSLGRAYSGACDYARAAGIFEQVLERLPGNWLARLDLAVVQFYSGQYTRPRATLQALLKEAADDHASMTYASLLLRAGEFREGWQHYDARWAMGRPGRREFPEPRWQGESLAGKTLLLAAEQGLGDEIMFASIFPEVMAMADHCIIECDERLVPLYQRSFPDATLFGIRDRNREGWHTQLDAARATLPRFDCWAPIGDLGQLRRNEAADFPRHSGYLAADAQRVRDFRQRLQSRGIDKLKIGIGWKGGTRSSRAPLRSMTLQDLKPLFTLPDTHFVSLQYGDSREERERFAHEGGVALDHWQADIDDIDSYAALVSSLDLVISVCSAVIHLAGALGKPAWVMAPLVPEWRYGREGESMIWYPSVRMFRQEKSGDWAKVIGQVRRALQRRVVETRENA